MGRLLLLSFLNVQRSEIEVVEEYHKGLSHLKDSGWENTWKKKLPLSCFHTKKAHLSILTYMCQCSLTDVFYPCSLGWMSKRVDGAAFGKTKRDGGNLSIVPRWVSCNPPYQVEGLGLIPRSHQTISTWSHDKYVTLLHVTQRTHRKCHQSHDKPLDLQMIQLNLSASITLLSFPDWPLATKWDST